MRHHDASSEHPTPPATRAWQLALVVAGAIALLTAWLFSGTSREDFLRAWLISYMPWWEATVGCLGVLMLHHLMGGNWGRAVRPALEAGAGLFPLLALGFLPIALNLEAIFPWAAESAMDDPLIARKAAYLNEQAFWIRAILYFGLWMITSLMLIPRRDLVRKDPHLGYRLTPRRAAIGLVLLVLTASFAAIDWGMSLEPHWFSSMYGPIYVAGGGVTAMALMILVAAGLHMDRPVRNVSRKRIRGDLASLQLAMIMVWTYFAFSQFLLIWSANLPEETVWYLVRLQQGWWYLAIAVIALHFVVPFALLLSQDVRFHPRGIKIVAVTILVGHALHLLWILAPAFYDVPGDIPWAVPVTFVGTTCLWVAAWLWSLENRLAAAPERTP